MIAACTIQAERLSARAASSAPESAVASSAEQREEQAPAEANAPAAKPGFVNRQVFKVPEDMQPVFEEAWAAREEHMATMAGYLGVQMHKEGADSYVVESRWESIPAWEEFNLSKPARRHHLPTVRSSCTPECMPRRYAQHPRHQCAAPTALPCPSSCASRACGPRHRASLGGHRRFLLCQCALRTCKGTGSVRLHLATHR